MAAVVAAYLLGRCLGRLQAVAAGLAAALAPGALGYLSLKQYTADAFVTLLLLWLAAGSRRAGTAAGSSGCAWPASRRCWSAT